MWLSVWIWLTFFPLIKDYAEFMPNFEVCFTLNLCDIGQLMSEHLGCSCGPMDSI